MIEQSNQLGYAESSDCYGADGDVVVLFKAWEGHLDCNHIRTTAF